MLQVNFVSMKYLSAKKIITLAEQLIKEANFLLPPKTVQKLQEFAVAETDTTAKTVLMDLVKNTQIAQQNKLPLCQDTGTAVFFVEIGHLVTLDEPLMVSLTQAVKNSYKSNYLRASIVGDPLFDRKNTGDNCPPVVHIKQIVGEGFRLRFLPKGGGAENKSIVKMLRPVDGRQGVIKTVIEAAQAAGGASCPPWLVGVGIGGSFDSVAEIAKEALFRPIGERHEQKEYAELETEIAAKIEDLHIGALGLGGNKTVLAVHILARPTHIASLPVAVNFQCHSARMATGEL